MMGWGAFLLGLSLLPPKILKLLEFVGLQGNKKLGLDLIIESEKMDILRSFAAAYGLLVRGLMAGKIAIFRTLYGIIILTLSPNDIELPWSRYIARIEGALDRSLN